MQSTAPSEHFWPGCDQHDALFVCTSPISPDFIHLQWKQEIQPANIHVHPQSNTLYHWPFLENDPAGARFVSHIKT